MKKVHKKGKLLIFLGALILLGLLVYQTGFQIKVQNTKISLEELCQQGSSIYDSEGKPYTKLDIRKCAQWISLEQISEELRGIKGGKLRGKYAEYIVKQFKPEVKEKRVLEKALEKNCSSEELEEFFWNTVYLGDGVFGIGSAAKRFFGCEFAQVSRDGLVMLGQIIEEYLEKNSLEGMKIEVYDDSMLYEESGYVDGVIKETAQQLMAEGMDELTAYNMIFLQGLHIYTYMDTSIQKILEEAYSEKTIFTIDTSDNAYIQSSMVIMDNQGKIKAVAAGNNNDKIFNRAAKKYRVGSTIKPVSTYSLGIEKKLIHFSAMVENRQLLRKNEAGEEVAWPSNSDGEYGGRVTVTRGLQESKNTIAVQIGMMVGEEVMFAFLQKELGYDLVYYENQNSDCQLSALTLGYFYKGISLGKITASYEMFSNGGHFYDSAMVSRIENAEKGKLFTDSRKGRKVLSEDTAFIVNRLLYNNVHGKYGIAKGADIEGTEVIGKTGTTGNEDGASISRLFIGATVDYIAGVWIGYDDGRSLKLKSYKSPDEIYAQIMKRIPHSEKSFAMPESVLEREYCELTGMLATDKCEFTDKGYYTEDNMPEMCSLCQDKN